jgi:demethylmenaquinone methyltransferase/2-methoxy-6-polyprenyl-1,4-benzoquinol methylase
MALGNRIATGEPGSRLEVVRDPLPRAEDKGRAVRAMFDRIAPRYDALNRVLSLGLDRGWRRFTLDAIAVGPLDRVLDLACGTGDLAALAAARGAQVVGIDFARAMLGGAQARGIGCPLAQGDAAMLPLPDAWASVVTCGFALRNFVSLPPVFAELARVVAPAGRIALLDVDRPQSALVRAGHTFWFDRVVPRVGGWFSDRQAYAYLPRSTVYLPPAAAMRAQLANCGFECVAKRSLLFGAAQLWTARRCEVRA